MLLRQGVKAALPNIQTQTQRSCQNDETKKNGPNERTEQKSGKSTKWKGYKQPIRCRVQNTSYKDAQTNHWVLQQHKKDPGRNEGLSKIKKNPQGTKVEGMKPGFKSTILNIRNKKAFNQNSKKKKKKEKMRIK